MFKLTGRGGYRASGGGGQTSARIQGLHSHRGAAMPLPLKPAFVPDTIQEHGFDSSTPRVSEPGETRAGYTGANIGA